MIFTYKEHKYQISTIADLPIGTYKVVPFRFKGVDINYIIVERSWSNGLSQRLRIHLVEPLYQIHRGICESATLPDYVQVIERIK